MPSRPWQVVDNRLNRNTVRKHFQLLRKALKQKNIFSKNNNESKEYKKFNNACSHTLSQNADQDTFP